MKRSLVWQQRTLFSSSISSSKACNTEDNINTSNILQLWLIKKSKLTFAVVGRIFIRNWKNSTLFWSLLIVDLWECLYQIFSTDFLFYKLNFFTCSIHRVAFFDLFFFNLGVFLQLWWWVFLVKLMFRRLKWARSVKTFSTHTFRGALGKPSLIQFRSAIRHFYKTIGKNFFIN